MYKSTDAGKTWTFTGFRDGQNISKIRIHPTNPDIVFVAVFGHYGAPNDERGIFKTTDGGKTWRRVLFRDNKTAGVDLWIDRNNPDVIYAALWEAFRMEYTMSSGGPGSGLFKSTDGGEHWTEITRNPGLPQTGLDRQDRRDGVGRGLESRLRARRERQRRRLPIGRRGRDVEADVQRPQPPPARVLLHAHHGRSAQQGSRLRPGRRHVQVH